MHTYLKLHTVSAAHKTINNYNEEKRINYKKITGKPWYGVKNICSTIVNNKTKT